VVYLIGTKIFFYYGYHMEMEILDLRHELSEGGVFYRYKFNNNKQLTEYRTITCTKCDMDWLCPPIVSSKSYVCPKCVKAAHNA